MCFLFSVIDDCVKFKRKSCLVNDVAACFGDSEINIQIEFNFFVTGFLIGCFFLDKPSYYESIIVREVTYCQVS